MHYLYDDSDEEYPEDRYRRCAAKNCGMFTGEAASGYPVGMVTRPARIPPSQGVKCDGGMCRENFSAKDYPPVPALSRHYSEKTPFTYSFPRQIIQGMDKPWPYTQDFVTQTCRGNVKPAYPTTCVAARGCNNPLRPGASGCPSNAPGGCTPYSQSFQGYPDPGTYLDAMPQSLWMQSQRKSGFGSGDVSGVIGNFMSGLGSMYVVFMLFIILIFVVLVALRLFSLDIQAIFPVAKDVTKT